MNVITIDYSKKCTGIFTKIDGVETSLTIRNKVKCSQEKALCNIYTQFIELLSSFRFDFGVVEVPRNSAFQMGMFEIGGVIKLAFAQKGIPLIPIYVQTWKTLTIKKADKKRVKAYLDLVEDKYKRRFKTTDEADAYMIYKAIILIAKKTKGMTKGMLKIKDSILSIIQSYR